jgi:hypothetical protein
LLRFRPGERAGGQLSNGVPIAIAAAGQTSCNSQVSAATLSKLDSGGNIVLTGLSIGDVVGYEDLLGGVFNRYTAAEWLLPYSGPKFGLCTVLDETYSARPADMLMTPFARTSGGSSLNAGLQARDDGGDRHQ